MIIATGPQLCILPKCCIQSTCTGSFQHTQPSGACTITAGSSQPNLHLTSRNAAKLMFTVAMDEVFDSVDAARHDIGLRRIGADERE